MRRLLLFLGVSIALFTIHSCTKKIEVTEQKYKDGSPKLVVTYEVNGDTKTKLSAIQYYQNGQIEYQGSYNKEGKRVGHWVYYYEDGTLWSEAEYLNGERHGKSAVYYENGKVRYTGNYKDGKTVGKWLFYDEKGNIVKELNY